MGLLLEIIIGMMVFGLVIFGTFIMIIAKTIKGVTSSKGNEEYQDEARMIQEMYKGFQRMGDRLEALETLLLDLEKDTDTKDGSR